MNGNFHKRRMIQRQERLRKALTFEYSLFILRDVLYPACSVRDLQIYWFMTQRAIISSATTIPKLNCTS